MPLRADLSAQPSLYPASSGAQVSNALIYVSHVDLFLAY